jgi:hypothetical protein|tara:strand:+ start:558 stop:713 length:156 start_codon:yes stop_codon:yes gene_type:complete
MEKNSPNMNASQKSWTLNCFLPIRMLLANVGSMKTPNQIFFRDHSSDALGN